LAILNLFGAKRLAEAILNRRNLINNHLQSMVSLNQAESLETRKRTIIGCKFS
jgi:hypothetical protein